MQLHLGYFKNFKGADTLLVAGDPEGVDRLAQEIERFAASEHCSLQLEPSGCRVAAAELWLAKARLTGGRAAWLITPANVPDIASALRSLAKGAPAHQYFEPLGSRTQLMVSAGEYPIEWWRAQA